MKAKLNIILTCLFTLMLQNLFAQERAVSGTVTGQDGSPVPGVSVAIRGTTTATSTDTDGRYTIRAAPTDVLVFSYIGMITRELPAVSATLNVTMSDETTEIETVVVTAVGIKREKSSLGSATTTLRSEDIERGAQPNINDAIKGKVAGVVISNASTDPGASSGIIIRGFSSLQGTNQPLFVVDGIPINNTSNFSSSLSGGYDFGRGSGDINPDDIASLTVLKGASATALYGSRAANGVIIITTKKGQAGKLAIDFSTTSFFTEILRTPKYQSSFGQGWDGQHYLGENGSWGPRFDNRPRVWGNIVNNAQLIKPYSFQEDQLENFFNTGISNVNTLSVSGGSGDSTVRLSYSNTQQDGIFPTDADSFERNTIGLSGTTKVSGFTLAGNMNYVNTGGSSVGTGQGLSAMNNLMQIPTDIPITEFADYNNPFHNVSNYYTSYGVTNPYFTLNENGSDYNKERFYGSLEVSATINKWSSFTYRFGIDQQTDLLRIWTAEVNAEPGSPNDLSSTEQPGTYAESSSSIKQLNHDLLYNLNLDLSDNINLVSTFGFNSNTRSGTSFAASVGTQDIPGFFSLANTGQSPTVGTARNLRKLYGLYNSTTISYDNMLYLTGNVRNDWYSTLPRENRSILYGGANVSWVASNTFPEIKSVVNYLKIRGGYGETGVDTDPYQILPVFTSTTIDNQGFGSYDFPIGGINAYGLGNRAGNPNLQPERRREFEVGLEASFFNNRISIDATYYNARVENQILNLPLAGASGFTNQTANVGTISNKGFEALLTLGWIKHAEDGFNWSTSVNFSKNNSVLEKLDPRLESVPLGGLSTISFVARPGQPVGLIEGPVAQRDPDGNIIVDTNGIPIATTTDEVYGDTQYDYTMGISNTFSYKGLSLDFTLDIRQGGLMYSRTADITRFTGNSITTTFNDRQPFIVPGSVVANGTDAGGNTVYVPNTVPVDTEHMDDYYSAEALSRYTVIDKSFIKLREVVLSYALPQKYLDNTFIQGITVSLIGRNLFLWTPRSNQYIDPEVSTFGTDIGSQFGEFSANPSTRSMGFAIRANF